MAGDNGQDDSWFVDEWHRGEWQAGNDGRAGGNHFACRAFRCRYVGD